jgi:hypothetical protein
MTDYIDTWKKRKDGVSWMKEGVPEILYEVWGTGPYYCRASCVENGVPLSVETSDGSRGMAYAKSVGPLDLERFKVRNSDFVDFFPKIIAAIGSEGWSHDLNWQGSYSGHALGSVSVTVKEEGVKTYHVQITMGIVDPPDPFEYDADPTNTLSMERTFTELDDITPYITGVLPHVWCLQGLNGVNRS